MLTVFGLVTMLFKCILLVFLLKKEEEEEEERNLILLYMFRLNLNPVCLEHHLGISKHNSHEFSGLMTSTVELNSVVFLAEHMSLISSMIILLHKTWVITTWFFKEEEAYSLFWKCRPLRRPHHFLGLGLGLGWDAWFVLR